VQSVRTAKEPFQKDTKKPADPGLFHHLSDYHGHYEVVK
jgi:hypothetical protein